MSKTETQSEALRIAEEFEACGILDAIHSINEICQAALELRRLDAENKALRERLEIDPSHPIDGIEARDETIRQMEAQIKDLRPDAERYRWLRETHNDSCGAFAVAELGQGDWKVIEEVTETAEHDLDAAIDAAMAAAKIGGAA